MQSPRIPLIVAVCLLPISFFGQGSLAPSAAPTPTLKTLQQIEPRIDLQNAPAAAVTTTNANYHYIINQPGSYFLSDNIGVTKPNGIQINVEGVSLDLRGFQISRASGSGGDGIFVGASGNRVQVAHGGIKGFADGIECSQLAKGGSFRELSVTNCTAHGISANPAAIVELCRVQDCSGTIGISVREGGSVRQCIVKSCAVDFGIYLLSGGTVSDSTATGITGTNALYVGTGCSAHNCAASESTVRWGINTLGGTLTNCSSYANTSADLTSGGFFASAATVTHCTSYANVTSASASSGKGVGFSVDLGIIQNCTADSNQGDGIILRGNVVARDNTSSNNGASGDGAGIHAATSASGNRIESNQVSGNDRGIDIDGTHNFIVKNTANGNTTNFDIAADNRYGPIEDITAAGSAAASGNTAATTLGNNNAWANFAY